MRALLVVAWLAAPVEAAPCRAAKAVVSGAQLEGTRVVACFDRGPRPCWGLDLARPVWRPVPASARRALEACGAMPCGSSARSTIPSSAVVTACAPDGTACHTVATPPALGLEVVTDGALVAVVEDERITVADLRTGAVAATIAPWSHPRNSQLWTFRGAVQFVGPDRLFVELGDGDTTLARVVVAHTGATALELPGGLDRARPVSLGDELAIAAAGGTELVLVDSKRLARRAIPLFAGQAPLALLAATAQAIVAVQQGGDGTLAIVDGKAARLVPGPPSCP